TTFSFTDIVTVNDQSERNQSGEKNQSTLRQDLVATLRLMERYLQCYGEFVQNQLRSLDYTEISSDTNEFKEKVEVIVNRLYEINKLEKNHPVIFAFFPQDMMEQFPSKLEKTWLNLSGEMTKCARQSNFRALNNRISATKALSMLDDYTKPNCKFRDLFLKHQEALFNYVIDASKVLKAIEEHRYTDVDAEMFKINQYRDGDVQAERVFEKLQNSLSRSLKGLINNVMMLRGNDMNLENVIKLEEQLRWIEEAKNFVFEYIENNTKKEIEKMERETKSLIEKRILEAVKTVKVTVNSCNFLEAEENIKLLRKFNCILGKEIGKVANNIDELETQLQNVLKNVVYKYKQINLKESCFNPYAPNPPKELYVKLSKNNYKESWDAIEEDITQKVRDQLMEIRKQAKNLNPKELETSFRVCKSVLNSLPKHMEEILGEEIKQCREDSLIICLLFAPKELIDSFFLLQKNKNIVYRVWCVNFSSLQNSNNKSNDIGVIDDSGYKICSGSFGDEKGQEIILRKYILSSSSLEKKMK
ncbi:anchored putative adhesin, partial [Reticulomyxa filosa]